MKKRFYLTAGLFFFFLSLIYLSSFAKEEKKEENKYSLEEIQSCQKNSDCMKIISTCCPCSSGGKNFSINKKYKEYWKAFLKTKCKEKKICPAVYRCYHNENPKCVSNVCTLVKRKDKKKWDNW